MDQAGMKQEMVGDMMAMNEDPNADADADEMYDGILGEIGLAGSKAMGGPVASTGIAVAPVPAPVEVQANAGDAELEARLQALRM